MWFYLLASGFRLIDEPFHNFWVFAGMNGQHSASQKHTIFFSDSLILVLWVDILEDLFGGQRFAVEVIAFYPESGSVVVLIVGDVDVVFAEVLFFLVVVLVSAYLDKAILVLDFWLGDLLTG